MSSTPRRREVEGIPASLIPSACPDEELSTPNRLDPYWDRLWAPGSQALWSTGSMARHRSATGQRVNSRHLIPEEEALRLLTANRGRTDRLAFWSAVDSWRTVSAEQAAAITGSPLLLDPNYSSIAASFAIDVIDIGLFSGPGRTAPGMNRSTLFRPSNTEAFDKKITPTLTWPEWVTVTGGYPWSGGGQYDRHNLLATELGLRAAEYLPVGAVLGEKFSTVDLLAGTGLGKTVKNPDNRRADGTIVRPDGLRIAFEITATASKSLESKVRRWAQIITERPLETSGLTIVFVAAPHPDRPRSSSADPRHEIYRRVAAVLREFPGRGKDSPAARIGIAAWEEWFPARHELSDDFFDLNADFAVGDAPGAGRWQARSLLNMDFHAWETFDATAVVEVSKLLGATPYWMRAGDHTHLIGSPLQRAGDTVPVPSPVRPEKTKGRALGEAVGNGGPAGLPPRLKIER